MPTIQHSTYYMYFWLSWWVEQWNKIGCLVDLICDSLDMVSFRLISCTSCSAVSRAVSPSKKFNNNNKQHAYSVLHTSCGKVGGLNDGITSVIQSIGSTTEVSFRLISCSCSAVSRAVSPSKHKIIQKATCLRHFTYYWGQSWWVKYWTSNFC